jgi:hypothetical protein
MEIVNRSEVAYERTYGFNERNVDKQTTGKNN